MIRLLSSPRRQRQSRQNLSHDCHSPSNVSVTPPYSRPTGFSETQSSSTLTYSGIPWLRAVKDDLAVMGKKLKNEWQDRTSISAVIRQGATRN